MEKIIAQLTFDNQIAEKFYEAREEMAELINVRYELTALTDELDEALLTVRRLQGISAQVSTLGLCRSSMEGFDPLGELVELGISPSYETLSDTFIKDEVSEEVTLKLDQAVEGIIGVVKSIIKKIKDHFDEKRIKNEKLTAKYAAMLSELEDKLKGISSFDDESFGNVETRSFVKSDFTKLEDLLVKYRQTAVKVFDDVVKGFNDVKSKPELGVDGALEKNIIDLVANLKPLENKEFRDNLGMFVKIEENGVKVAIRNIKPILIDKRDRLKVLGWVTGDAEKLANKCLTINDAGIKFYNKTDEYVDKLIAVFNEFVRMYNSALADYKKGDKSKEGHLYDIDQYLRYCEWMINRFDTIHDVTYHTGREMFSTAANVCRAAIKCGK
jgi:hypothetical protein